MAQAGREKIAICSLEFCDLTTALGIFTSGSCGVVVITCASHAQGPRFDPGRKQIFFFKSTDKEQTFFGVDVFITQTYLTTFISNFFSLDQILVCLRRCPGAFFVKNKQNYGQTDVPVKIVI